ncbi:MAG: cytochrome c oxidase subunit 3 [Pseudonocardia sp.]
MTTTRNERVALLGRSKRETHLPGEEGVWVLIFGDMLLFGVFFATFLFYRGRESELFTASQQTLSLDLGAINTLLLLSSSLVVVTGVRAIRHGARTLAPAMFAIAFACGAGFGFIKYLEYSDKIINGITPGTNNFYMYYFILTGLHMFHVLIGMGVLIFMYAQARKPEMTTRRLGYIEGGACFWHMVDLLWIVLFPLIYLVRA